MGGLMEEKERTKPNDIYHEKQHLQFCLLHALNNLLQVVLQGLAFRLDLPVFGLNSTAARVYSKGNESFTRTQLDAIANKLMLSDPNKDRWNPLSVIWKPHHNVLTGNYDINVLFAALESKGKHVVWYDRRKCALSMDLTSSADALTGIILNNPTRKWGGLWRSRHWIALRKIDGIWYNLDSDLVTPVAFEHGEEEMKSFLNESLAQGGEVLIVFEGNSSGTTILSEE